MSFRTLCDIPGRLRSEVDKPDQLLHKEEGSWRALSSRQFCDRIRDLAIGLRSIGIGSGDRVAVLSENRPEWTITDYAALSAGAATVPIYPTLLPDQVEFILRDSGARVACVSTPDQLAKVLAVRPALPDLREVLVFDAPSVLSAGARPWRRLLAEGAEARGRPGATADLDQARPGDLASIIYTSGTTGQPKGAMLTHANFVHNVTSCCAAIPFQVEDVCLSILPLSHIYERMVEYCYLHRGATIAYAQAIETMAADMAEVRPTIVCAVPRLFEKMYRRVLDNGSSLPFPRSLIFRWAIEVARRCGERHRDPGGPGLLLTAQQRLADRLVFSAVRKRLGGRMRFFVSGSAPLSIEVARVFHGMGIRILEGYGLTETSPVIAVNRLDSICLGSVGPPIEGAEVRIEADGEILTRGPSVMLGYHHNDEATREVLRDGWFATGDIGRFDAHGCLVITDRKKEVLKTSGGKMVAPQPIENLLRADRFIGQAVVIGERRHFISALIVPNFDQIRSYAVIKGIAETDMPALLRHPRILNLFERRIAAINGRLPRYEQVRRFQLLETEFTVEAGEITPTLKPRRKAIEQRYRAAIESMYAEADPRTSQPGQGTTRTGTGS